MPSPSPKILFFLSALTLLGALSGHFVRYYLRVWGLQKLSVCLEDTLASVTANGIIFVLSGLIIIIVDLDFFEVSERLDRMVTKFRSFSHDVVYTRALYLYRAVLFRARWTGSQLSAVTVNAGLLWSKVTYTSFRQVFSDMALSVSQKRQSAPVYPDEVASDSDITAANTMKWRTLLWSDEKLFAFRQMLMMKEVGKKLDIIQDVDRDIQDMEAAVGNLQGGFFQRLVFYVQLRVWIFRYRQIDRLERDAIIHQRVVRRMLKSALRPHIRAFKHRLIDALTSSYDPILPKAFPQSPTPFDAITVIALLTQKMSADLDPVLDHAVHEFTVNWTTSDGSQAKAFHELISMNRSWIEKAFKPQLDAFMSSLTFPRPTNGSSKGDPATS
ncbi:hypothetical protein IW261DRAFT_1573274 [Armillaria novae-zelandiae]|uniref:Uncharacterized protein n=1 Tax=Armillaria novae-zelandiae TaxID=153914 RepID=A0AA39NNY2_9AGAR|nr:hypothetical protein IW261DRAFT_1573274 [Armillaria novae-zelandiae]